MCCLTFLLVIMNILTVLSGPQEHDGYKQPRYVPQQPTGIHCV